MRISTLLTLMIASVLLNSCKPSGSVVGTHKFDTVAFEQTSPPAVSAEPVPKVWVDTNMEVDGLIGGGTVQSKSPYHIRLDYTDNSSSLSALEITMVEVTYDDGTVEAATKRLALPHRIAGRPYETVNSISGGRIVRSTVDIFSGVLRDAITQDASLTLKIEGFFTTHAGTTQSFTINSHYTVRFDKSIKPLVDR